jgi:hypothetical protein
MQLRESNLFIVVLFLLFLNGCTGKSIITSALEGGASYLENPSMELVLDRMNTAAAAAELSDAILNEIDITDSTDWPQRVIGFSKEDIQPTLQALALDGAYVAHGGIVSPIKANVVQVQHVLYELPPDLYSQSGTCYKKGEKTLINGFYYHVGGRGIKNGTEDKTETVYSITQKNLLDLDFGTISTAVKQSAKNIFVNTECGSNDETLTNIVKREGLLRSVKSGLRRYQGVMAALMGIVSNGDEIQASYKNLDKLKKKIEEVSQELKKLEKSRNDFITGERDNLLIPYDSKDKYDDEITSRKSFLQENEAELEDCEQLFLKNLEKISENDPAIMEDAGKKKVLINIVDACTGMLEMLTGALTLTTISIAKLPTSVVGLPAEVQALVDSVKNKDVKAVYIPLRLARLRFNGGNVIDNIKLLAKIINIELSLTNKVKSEVEELLSKSGPADTENHQIADSHPLSSQEKTGLSESSKRETTARTSAAVQLPQQNIRPESLPKKKAASSSVAATPKTQSDENFKPSTLSSSQNKKSDGSDVASALNKDAKKDSSAYPPVKAGFLKSSGKKNTAPTHAAMQLSQPNTKHVPGSKRKVASSSVLAIKNTPSHENFTKSYQAFSRNRTSDGYDVTIVLNKDGKNDSTFFDTAEKIPITLQLGTSSQYSYIFLIVSDKSRGILLNEIPVLVDFGSKSACSSLKRPMKGWTKGVYEVVAMDKNKKIISKKEFNIIDQIIN